MRLTSVAALIIISAISVSAFNFELDDDDVAEANPVCVTPDAKSGKCINLTKCRPLIRLLKRPVPKKVVTLLRNSVCGFKSRFPDVCCPDVSRNAPITATTTTSTTTLPTTTTTTAGITTTTTTLPTTTTAEITTTTESVPLNETENGAEITTNITLPSNNECGKSTVFHPLIRIVNGRPAKPKAWPWMAALGYKNEQTNETRYLCGGTLISRRHVLTAAHCIIRNDLRTVRLGEHDISSDEDGANPVDIPIKSKLMHSGFNSRFYHNDIALLLLDENAEEFYSEWIRPICMPWLEFQNPNPDYAGANPFITGWGVTRFYGPQADILQEAQLEVLSNEACKAIYRNFDAVWLMDNMMCAMDKAENSDSCQGDSGGPMMTTSNNTWFQIGVVSFGYKCAQPGFPGVYTRLTEFRDWIESNLNEPYIDVVLL